MEKVINVQSIIDKTAVSLSIACIAHCLLLPIAMVALPVLTTVSLEDELFHQLLLIGVLPISIIALTMGCRKHKSWRVVFLGAIGLVILSLTAFFGHDVLGESGEKLATLVGASIIAVGHIRNHRLCNKTVCHQN
ncbi:MerC domain-containing protein [Endozoicomonas sp. SM1973]|uniref:MerC domain-containing protein n=1 Tax=Spartinivicinus marinus TaxID=2994442 RepID=A0A853IB13_9GAMM|nr:MerC domain-containing protein [Spartinivicinus marinus]MCX4027025.1 MerC domain-containing protein [Spartinivicinus marinus]NYZ67021.1 MerC domain-containing protein [Spartinivicinus marinus]